MELEKFVNNYIKAWSTTKNDERHQLIEKVYSPSASFYANEPEDDAIIHQGLDKIYENITMVNERLVKGNGLITDLTSYSENHGTVRVTWQMKTSDGNPVIKGMNFLHLDHSNKIERDYIFIN